MSARRSLPRLGEPPPVAAESQPLALLALGFRPFFLAAGALATSIIPLWLLVVRGNVELPIRLSPTRWHGHEMLFGFTVAVIAGFLLTAVRNWTSRPTASGATLAGLVSLWIAGRIALLFGAWMPNALSIAIDLAFLPCLALAIGAPIVRAKAKRNMPFIALLLLMTAANALFHAGSVRALPFALDLVLVMIAIMGGRVIPMFTGNATRLEVKKHPRLDLLAIGSMVLVALLDVVPVRPEICAATAIVAGLLNGARMIPWRSLSTVKQPILWVLHLGYAWLGVGLVLRGVAWWVPSWIATAPLHLLAVGAIATLILGMMARVSLGHTGRLLVVRGSVTVAFAALGVATVLRGLGPLIAPSAYVWLLIVSGGAWTLAFAIFTTVYAPILASPRVDGKEG